MWTVAPAGHATSDGEMHEVRFAAYDNEAKSKSNTITKLFMCSQSIIIIKSLKIFLSRIKRYNFVLA